MQAWVIPGAPLPDRSGWRVWYALDPAAAGPQPPRVSQGGRSLSARLEPVHNRELDGYQRRVHIVDLVIDGLQPGATCAVYIPEINKEFHWQTHPGALPSEGMSIAFSSCFWQYDDGEGYLQRAFDAILDIERPRPAFKLLLGDQVYLDWPGHMSPWTLRKGGWRLVGERYERYWGDEGYRNYLSSIPNHVCADDHEFWNDYPEKQAQLPITWFKGLKEEFGVAAQAYWENFQQCLNPRGMVEPWTIIDLDPVSIFIADTRTQRSYFADPNRCFMAEDQWTALKEWQNNLKGPGLLAVGQPVFQNDGDWRDHSLSNFRKDYTRLLDIIEASLRGDNAEGKPHNIVILSGDIHNARCTSAKVPSISNPMMNTVYELISSATSAIGPYTKNPQQNPVPEFLPPKYKEDAPSKAWEVSKVNFTAPYDDVPAGSTQYASVDNNICLIRLFPGRRNSALAHLEYVCYQVRPYHKPAWQFWRRSRSFDYDNPAGLRTFTHTIDLR